MKRTHNNGAPGAERYAKKWRLIMVDTWAGQSQFDYVGRKLTGHSP